MKRYFRIRRFLPVFGAFMLLIMAGSLLLACKSKPAPPAPPPPPEPLPEIAASLVFQGIKANDPNLLHLQFSLNIENPFPSAGRVKIETWQVEINGNKAGTGFGLEDAAQHTGNNTGTGIIPGSTSFPLMLNMDVAALAAQGLAPADDYKVKLILDLNLSFDSAPSAKISVSGLAEFPGVRPPVFSITSIAILKAELINTRFRVGLKIDNPNPFPVELSAFSYELYGNGRLWADGTERNVFKVKGKSSLQGNLFLLMNFINMKRDLLDQVIYLIDVNYRFAGETLVGTGVEYLPKFKTVFNLSGYSQVLDN